MIITHPGIDRDSIHKRIRTRYECSHQSHVVRKKIVKGGAMMIHAQCTRCGEMVGSALKKEAYTGVQIAEMPTWDDRLKNNYWGKFNEELTAAEATAKEGALQQFREQYDAYLETLAWKKKSELVLARAQGVCEGCRSAKPTQAHHLTYEHCGEEFLFELVAVCRPCHERLHGIQTIPAAPKGPERRREQYDEEDCPF